jgi:hypothetical protein
VVGKVRGVSCLERRLYVEIVDLTLLKRRLWHVGDCDEIVELMRRIKQAREEVVE